jgi:hypothetical protein
MRRKSISLICIIAFLFASIQILSAKNNRGKIICLTDDKRVCVVRHLVGGDEVVYGRRLSKPR